jgi:hypothetical protein
VIDRSMNELLYSQITQIKHLSKQIKNFCVICGWLLVCYQ